MSVSLVDSRSVSAAAGAVGALGPALDVAPAGAALRLVAACLPGSALAAAATDEAREWAAEMADVAGVFERYAAALEAALEDYRRHDATSAQRLRAQR